MADLYANATEFAGAIKLLSSVDDEETSWAFTGTVPESLWGGTSRWRCGTEIVVATVDAEGDSPMVVERGAEDSTPAAHGAGVPLRHRFTAEQFRTVGERLDSVEASNQQSVVASVYTPEMYGAALVENTGVNEAPFVQAAINAAAADRKQVTFLRWYNCQSAVTYPNSVVQTLPIDGPGRRSGGLNFRTDLGAGVWGLRPVTLDASSDVVLRKFGLRGPGYFNGITAVDSTPALMSGLYETGAMKVEHMMSTGFYDGIGHVRDHNSLTDTLSIHNRYNFTRLASTSTSDIDIARCDFSVATYASMRITAGAHLAGGNFDHVFFGYSPRGIKYDDNQTGGGIVNCTFKHCTWEMYGNLAIEGDASSILSDSTFEDCVFLNEDGFGILADGYHHLIKVGTMSGVTFKGDAGSFTGWGDTSCIDVVSGVNLAFENIGHDIAGTITSGGVPFITGGLTDVRVSSTGGWDGRFLKSSGAVTAKTVLKELGNSSVQTMPASAVLSPVAGVAMSTVPTLTFLPVATQGDVRVTQTSGVPGGSFAKVDVASAGQIVAALSPTDGQVLGVSMNNPDGSTATVRLSAGHGADMATETAARVAADAALALVAANTQTASYTLVLADGGKSVEMNHASNPLVLTVPPNASVAFPVGTIIEVCRLNAGTVTITPGAAVTIPNRLEAAGTTSRTVANRYGAATLRKRATNEWVLAGDIA